MCLACPRSLPRYTKKPPRGGFQSTPWAEATGLGSRGRMLLWLSSRVLSWSASSRHYCRRFRSEPSLSRAVAISVNPLKHAPRRLARARTAPPPRTGRTCTPRAPYRSASGETSPRAGNARLAGNRTKPRKPTRGANVSRKGPCQKTNGLARPVSGRRRSRSRHPPSRTARGAQRVPVCRRH